MRLLEYSRHGECSGGCVFLCENFAQRRIVSVVTVIMEVYVIRDIWFCIFKKREVWDDEKELFNDWCINGDAIVGGM